MYRKGQQFVPEAHTRQDPASVPDVLLAWIQALSGLDQAQRIQQAVLHLLNSRPGHTRAKPVQVPALTSLPHIIEYHGCGSEYALTAVVRQGNRMKDNALCITAVREMFRHHATGTDTNKIVWKT